MSRTERKHESAAMSAGASATQSLGAPWRKVCSGCGQSPEALAPLDAVAIARVLERRCASLLRHPEVSLAHRGGEPDSWSAMEPATQVSAVMGAAASRLCDLLGEEIIDADPSPTGPEMSPTAYQEAPMAVQATLADNVRSLVATIGAATSQDWDRPRPHTGTTASELVWLALHDATHHLEDAELILDAAVTGHRGLRTGDFGHC